LRCGFQRLERRRRELKTLGRAASDLTGQIEALSVLHRHIAGGQPTRSPARSAVRASTSAARRRSQDHLLRIDADAVGLLNDGDAALSAGFPIAMGRCPAPCALAIAALGAQRRAAILIWMTNALGLQLMASGR